MAYMDATEKAVQNANVDRGECVLKSRGFAYCVSASNAMHAVREQGPRRRGAGKWPIFDRSSSDVCFFAIISISLVICSHARFTIYFPRTRIRAAGMRYATGPLTSLMRFVSGAKQKKSSADRSDDDIPVDVREICCAGSQISSLSSGFPVGCSSAQLMMSRAIRLICE
eukprot:TRINITY_DN398_c0_g1_i7.p1 TRINITY_DN398_c0_g1~~TRINITY_DN398_c0_g1_i7.p1  ORF type:complete len:169 (+),score=5.36 TRINITY_DN398_c0_g1_i7:152-658(+)